MAKKGENIYKRKDGRWEARYRRGRSRDGKILYGYCYAATYREVKEKVYAACHDTENYRPKKHYNREKSLSEYCDEWLCLNKLRVKESTYVKYYSMIEKHIKPELGQIPAVCISSFTVEAFSRGLLTKNGLSSKTVKDILVLLKSILKYISKTGDPYPETVEFVYPKEAKAEMRVLTLDEQKVLTHYLMNDTDSCKFGVLLALFTGMRVGEVCALRWGDISFSEKTITVRSTMQRIKDVSPEAESKTKIIISEPKTDSSARVIPMTDNIAELCRRRRVRDPAAFVLTGSPDHFIEPKVLQNRIKQYAAYCGLEGVHFHTLRHSFATRCVEVDFELKSLSEILGHSSPKITLERYVHSSLELKRENMNKLEAMGF